MRDFFFIWRQQARAALRRMAMHPVRQLRLLRMTCRTMGPKGLVLMGWQGYWSLDLLVPLCVLTLVGSLVAAMLCARSAGGWLGDIALLVVVPVGLVLHLFLWRASRRARIGFNRNLLRVYALAVIALAVTLVLGFVLLPFGFLIHHR